MDIKIVRIVFNVFDEYGESIRLDLDRFEEALNDEAKDLLDECYLVILGFKVGLFDALMFDEDKDVQSYVDYLVDVYDLKREDALFLISVLLTLLEHFDYYFEFTDIDHLIQSLYQEQDFFQLSLIAKSYFLGFGVLQDYEKAFEINSYLYSQGFDKVTYDLGNMYEHGYGIEKDIEKAIVYYQSLKDDMCCFRLGMMYMLGEYFVQDERKALEYFSLSHYKDSYFYKGLLLEGQKEYVAAFQCYYEGSQCFQINCLYKVGIAFKMGLGVSLDLKEAYRYFQYGYYLMSGDCAYELALMYFDGLACEKNVGKALNYLEEAAELYCFNASTLLGQLYDSGKYVEKNLKKSSFYYKKAKESFEENNEDI